MAIAYDNSTGGSGASPFSFSHTVGTGINRLLIVWVYVNYNSDQVLGVTYNGVSMTRIGYHGAGTAFGYGYCYALANPTSGSNNVIVTSNLGTPYAIAISYTGAGLPDIQGYIDGSGGYNISLNLTTVVNNCWLAGIMWSNQGTNSAGSDTTLRISGGVNGVNVTAYDSNSAKTPAGTYALNASTQYTGNHSFFGVSIPPYVAPPVTGNFFLVLN